MTSGEPEITTLPVGMLQTNCYLVVCPNTRAALVIDPADEPERVLAAARQKGARIEQILLTHAHLDHIMGLPGVQRATGARLLVHRLEVSMLGRYGRLFGLRPDQLPKLLPDVELEGGEEVSVGLLRGTIHHTPGHSPGSVTLQVGRHLFTGDTLFAMGVGRTDLVGGSLETLLQSIQGLFALPDEYAVYPGHGPATTLGAEKAGNPYV